MADDARLDATVDGVDGHKASVDAVFLGADSGRVEHNGHVERCGQQRITPRLADFVFVFFVLFVGEEIGNNRRRHDEKREAVQRMTSEFILYAHATYLIRAAYVTSLIFLI